ncbi:hypothetical protein [Pseudomonas frederiksbergensis]|uniref:Methyltransferase domain-containing protein n=1 Tax=Pseudomonas frederiksbergensis TaxID=104087 RepID=A0AB33E973_9PSED|nr:hypothetical protein [Pseudomonas frederiksbergensis]ATE76874.1 hypothetical protein CNN82_10715 [Pseudomonas frederiksbergensis]
MTNRQPWLDPMRRRLILDPIVNDERSVSGTRLGKQPGWIFQHAIGGGQADFDQWIENLSPRDRVMLYALFNQKAHIDELIHAFDKLLVDLEIFQDATVIDIGCGPYTAGLALANVVGSRAVYRYFGIDRALSMCAFAEELAAEVRALGELDERTEISFHQEIDVIDFGRRRGTQVTVFILSYLLASDTIDVDTLVAEIDRASKRVGLGPTVLLYTNSAREEARAAYPKFKKLMVDAGFTEHIEAKETFADSDKLREIHYALYVRRATLTIPIAEFRI